MRKIAFTSLFLLSSFTANALIVEPMVAELQPAKGKNQVMFKIQNDNKAALPVEASALLISYDKNGNEINTESQDLHILPLTATIAPNSFQTFVVRYKDNANLPESKSYRVAFETAAVDTGAKDKGMQVQYELLSFLHVLPSNPIPEVLQKRTYQKNGKWFLELTNQGNSGAFLNEMDWKIGTGSKLNPVAKKDIKQHIKGSFLLPGDTQSFEFSPFKGVAAKTMKVAISE